MKFYFNLKIICQVNLNFMKVYISDILYGKHNPKASYLRSHSRNSNPQINSSEQHSLPHLFFPTGEGKVICQRQKPQ